MRALIIGILAVVGATLAPAAHGKITPAEARQSKNVTRLEPISDWNIDYGESRCRLSRFFGTQKERHLLSFVQSAPRGDFGMTLAGPKVRRYAESRRAYLGIRDDVVMRKAERAGVGDVKGIGAAMILSSFGLGETKAESETKSTDEGVSGLRAAGIDLDRAKSARHVTLKLNQRVLSFETGPLSTPFKALNDCTDSLLESWGLDPEQHRQYRPPRWVNMKSVSKAIASRYPSKALRKGQSGIFEMRLIVEADGKVSSCHLEKNTIADSLSSPACQVTMRDAEFAPATDEKDDPMRSFYSTTITYAMNP